MSDPDSIVSVSSQLACLWEVTARKPGNVHRYRDFADTTYLDFAASAATIALNLAFAHEIPVGEVIYHCVQLTYLHVGRNTNLGIILLFAPLARANPSLGYQADVERVLSELSVEDARWAYEAIRIAKPGGLGDAATADVRDEPTVTLREAMALAADRDTVARQYANGFREVFDGGVPAILHGIDRTGCVEGGIIDGHLRLMAEYPDTLIARKRGKPEAEEAARRAQRVLDLDWPRAEEGRREIRHLDDWLRADGNGRNPGTTADLIAASLFVLLRQGRLSPRSEVPWPLAAGAP